MQYLQAIFLGIVQGLTEWLPVSSSGHLVVIQDFLGSGFTITTELLRGVERREIFRFSFLLSIPAIIGANVFEVTRVSWAELEIGSMLVGTLAAAIVGYLSLKLLMRLVLNRKFHLFSFYCLALGLFILAVNLH